MILKKSEKEIHESNIALLDSFHEQSRTEAELIPQQNDWIKENVLDLFKQSNNITFCLLSNTIESKFRNQEYVTDIVLFGSLGRILRDIYVKIIYLKSTDYSEIAMRACWDYQIVYHELKLIEFETSEDLTQYKIDLMSTKEKLLSEIKNINFKKIDDVIKGKDEKLVTIDRLAEIKGFNKARFTNEFSFFSQFSHSTAYANSLNKPNGIKTGMLAIVYDKLIAYYIAIIVESLSILSPKHHQLDDLKMGYDSIINRKWN
jgi:hypothetical protein